MKKKKMTKKRWREIALANFDRYVTRRLINPCYVIHVEEDSEEIINKRELGCFAKEMNCDPVKVKKVLIISLGRITKNTLTIRTTNKEEALITRAAAKLYIKENAVSMFNFKREFGRIIQDLNHHNAGLHISKEELYEFIKPLYLEAVEEIFSI